MLERYRICGWEILAFPSIGDVHLRKIVCRSLLVLLNIETIVRGRISAEGMKLEQVKRNNGRSGAYTVTLILPKTEKGNGSVHRMEVELRVLK